LALLRAARPGRTILTVAAFVAAAVAGHRTWREVALVGATVLVGQLALTWENDLIDAGRDRAHGRTGKPFTDEELDAGWGWYAVGVAVLALLPLAIANGIVAGLCYLGSVGLGLAGNAVPFLRRGWASFLPWAAAFALYPAFLSYGVWGGRGHGGHAPNPVTVALAAVLGICVHVASAVGGLLDDSADGWTYLPLRLGRAVGAMPMLVGATVAGMADIAAIAIWWHLHGVG